MKGGADGLLAADAVERAMKRQEVIMRALSGTLTWLQAADILGLEPRSVRRWRARFEAGGAVALYDRRQLPSPRKAPALEVQRLLRLYRERFAGWNVRHCSENRSANARNHEHPATGYRRAHSHCCAGERRAHDHSITWSARSSTDCGIVRPSAFAVLRLITSSNFVGCSTGRSAGLAPLRILST